MGRGNVRVNGLCEGLFYIDYDYTAVYKNMAAPDGEPDRKLRFAFGTDSPEELGWEYDAGESVDEEDYDMRLFSDDFTNAHQEFSETNIWVSRSRRAILESALFYIAVEDNEWSFAVELLQKDVESEENEKAQMELYSAYLESMKIILLSLYPSIGTYAGAWTSGRITREDA